MAGHHKFSRLTQDFSAERKAKIAAKTAQLIKEIAEHQHIAEKLDTSSHSE
jgi:hypothetical protein